MYLTRFTGFLLVSLSVVLMPAQAQKYGTQRGTVEFTSRVPLHTFTGTSDYLSGEIDLENRTVDFFVDLETLRTGIGRRDRDMREALETDDYPFAEFTGRLLTPFDPEALGAQRVRVQGTFKIHGVSRTMTVSGTLEKTGSQIRMIADWTINLRHYKIAPARLLQVQVTEVRGVPINALLSSR